MKKTKLINARKQKGLSVKEVADLMKMEDYSYRRRENGKVKISNEEWVRLAEILEVKFEDIFESENITFAESQDQPSNVYTVPEHLLENQREYIATLKAEISNLKAEIQSLKARKIDRTDIYPDSDKTIQPHAKQNKK